MKKLISIILALSLLTVCFAAFAETIELGITDVDELDFTAGNFQAVSADGSIKAKLYVQNSWIPETNDLEHAGEAVTALWTRGENEAFQTLICQNYGKAFEGIETPEAMLAFLKGIGFGGDIFTVSGIPAVLYHSEGKDTLGGYFLLPESGWLDVYVTNITSEELENEAMLILCSLTDAE